LVALEKIQRFDRGRCRKVFDKRFSAERMTADYVNIYERLVTERHARTKSFVAAGKMANGSSNGASMVKRFKPERHLRTRVVHDSCINRKGTGRSLHPNWGEKSMRYALVCCVFWVLLALFILGASRREIVIEDDLRVITDVPMERSIATGWKGWI
jgi:hypothetical protein